MSTGTGTGTCASRHFDISRSLFDDLWMTDLEFAKTNRRRFHSSRNGEKKKMKKEKKNQVKRLKAL